MSTSRRTLDTAPLSPADASYNGVPGSAGTCAMAISGLPLGKILRKRDTLTPGAIGTGCGETTSPYVSCKHFSHDFSHRDPPISHLCVRKSQMVTLTG